MKKTKKTGLKADGQLREFLTGYQDEDISIEFQRKIIKNAISSSKTAQITEMPPMWKRLSLAASIAAFALGIIMSNQVFSSSTESSDWNFGETGLYSYLVEGE